jgi:hypothetical protein
MAFTVFDRRHRYPAAAQGTKALHQKMQTPPMVDILQFRHSTRFSIGRLRIDVSIGC